MPVYWYMFARWCPDMIWHVSSSSLTWFGMICARCYTEGRAGHNKSTQKSRKQVWGVSSWFFVTSWENNTSNSPWQPPPDNLHPTCQSRLRYRVARKTGLRSSGRERWAQTIAVEVPCGTEHWAQIVRQGTLGSDGRGWSPAGTLGSDHRGWGLDQMVAVEVRQWTLNVAGRGWGLAGNAGRGCSRLRSDREHWTWLLAVKARGGQEEDEEQEEPWLT